MIWVQMASTDRKAPEHPPTTVVVLAVASTLVELNFRRLFRTKDGVPRERDVCVFKVPERLADTASFESMDPSTKFTRNFLECFGGDFAGDYLRSAITVAVWPDSL